MISKIEVERFTLSSSKPFDQVVAALNSAVGHPDIPEFWKSTHRAQSVAIASPAPKQLWTAPRAAKEREILFELTGGGSVVSYSIPICRGIRFLGKRPLGTGQISNRYTGSKIRAVQNARKVIQEGA
jgi:hypothetical protein